MEPKGYLATPVETQLGQLAVSFRGAGKWGSLLGLPKPVLPTLVGRWKSWPKGPFGFRLDAVPLFAAFAVGQFVGFLVPDEDFLLGIPGQFATKFVPDVA